MATQLPLSSPPPNPVNGPSAGQAGASPIPNGSGGLPGTPPPQGPDPQKVIGQMGAEIVRALGQLSKAMPDANKELQVAIQAVTAAMAKHQQKQGSVTSTSPTNPGLFFTGGGLGG